MHMQVTYSVDAQADLSRLPKNIRRRIIDKVGWYVEQDNPLEFAEPLKNAFRSLYRFRIGNYRAIFSLQGRHVVIVVVAVKHRSEAYRSM